MSLVSNNESSCSLPVLPLTLVCSLFLVAGCTPVINDNSSDPDGEQVLGEQVAAADHESSMCQTGIECSHIVPTPLYELLEEYIGDLESIESICTQTSYPMFCWKYASSSNPELREEICTFLAEHLYEQGVAGMEDPDQLEEFVEGHELDCLLGIPQLVY